MRPRGARERSSTSDILGGGFTFFCERVREFLSTTSISRAHARAELGFCKRKELGSAGAWLSPVSPEAVNSSGGESKTGGGRGTFPATFLIAALIAIGAEVVKLEDI